MMLNELNKRNCTVQGILVVAACDNVNNLLKEVINEALKIKQQHSLNQYILYLNFRWIMYIEKKVCDTDSTLIMYHENIRRIKRR